MEKDCEKCLLTHPILQKAIRTQLHIGKNVLAFPVHHDEKILLAYYTYLLDPDSQIQIFCGVRKLKFL